MANIGDLRKFQGAYFHALHIESYHVDLEVAIISEQEPPRFYRLRITDYGDFTIRTSGLYEHAMRSLQIERADFTPHVDDDYRETGKLNATLHLRGREGTMDIAIHAAPWELEEKKFG